MMYSIRVRNKEEIKLSGAPRYFFYSTQCASGEVYLKLFYAVKFCFLVSVLSKIRYVSTG